MDRNGALHPEGMDIMLQHSLLFGQFVTRSSECGAEKSNAFGEALGPPKKCPYLPAELDTQSVSIFETPGGQWLAPLSRRKSTWRELGIAWSGKAEPNLFLVPSLRWPCMGTCGSPVNWQMRNQRQRHLCLPTRPTSTWMRGKFYFLKGVPHAQKWAATFATM